ncbi:hypothetical protein FSARC_4814 [Fusarium sarcochroum]|uniref:Alpha/beta hydrolase fold-3 domain-containing protein n=1 Tax=Fusarium sarcochroum TaxID=1208366 RepID=A0A8H4U0X0_9HYPO|nr:hypothetical protein FSARC_4814 [Fusarium sarcochroum]
MATKSNIGYLPYLRLKILATCVRLAVKILSYTRLRRDKLLNQSRQVCVETLRIPSRNPGRFIKADLYSPDSIDSSKPILINWHGSGFILPMHGMDRVFCAHVARQAGIYVLDADYRKSPETPFPGPLEDAEDVTRWVSAQTNRFDKARMAVSGFSAGATIALATAVGSHRSLGITFSVAVVLYPFTDMSIVPEAKTVANPIKPLPPYVANIFNDSYVFDKSLRSDSRASPALADPEDFPATVGIMTCEGDILEPEGHALAMKLEVGGRRVSLKEMKGVPHAFETGAVEGTPEWQKREEAYAWAVEVLKSALHV